ncbi:MAG: lipopolysaccharide biosynthesis protein [Gaiellaceae bacterium]
MTAAAELELDTGWAGTPIRRLILTSTVFAASGGTTLLFNILLARVLGPERFGDLARTFSIGMAVALLTMAGVAPTLARAVAHGDERERPALARAAIRLLLIAATGFSALYGLLGLAGLAPVGALSLVSGFALAIVYATYSGLKLLLFALDRVPLYATLELTSDAIFVVSLLLLAALAPMAGVLAFAIAYAWFCGWAIHLLLRSAGAGRARIRVTRELLRYGGLASIATYASLVQVPAAIAVTGLVGGSGESGRIAVVLALAMPLWLVPQAAGVLTFAGIARARGMDVSLSVRQTVRVVFLISGVAVAAAAVLAHPLVNVLLGSAYRDLDGIFLLVVGALVLQLAAQPVANAFAAEGRVVGNVVVAALGLVAVIAGSLLLVPRYGATGAAVGTALSAVVMGGILLLRGRVRYGLTVGDLTEGLAVSGCGLVAALIFRSNWIPGSAVVALVAFVLLYRLRVRAPTPQYS